MTNETSSSQMLTSLALFIASVAVSRWCQPSVVQRGRQKKRGGSRQRYRIRRRKSRLSPDNSDRFRSLFQQHTSMEEDETAERINGHPVLTTHTSVEEDETAERINGAALTKHDSGQTGFYPKNKNWSHFEPSFEDDVGEALISPPSYDFDGESCSSVGDEFVWTQSKHQHNKKGSTWTKHFSRLGAISAFRQLTEEVRSSSDSSDDVSSTAGSSDYEEEMKKIEDYSFAGDEADAFMHSRQRGYLSHNSSGSLPTSILGGDVPRTISELNILDELDEEDEEPRRQDKSPEVAAYNASILPAKVIMIRHGQSEGNVNESLYATTPDNAMRITQLGWDQAHMAGQALKDKILPSGEPVHFIVSPYVRAVETFHGIVSAWCDPSEFNDIEDRDERIKAWYGRLLEMGLTWHEDPRIREQDFGNYQDPAIIKKCKRERHRFGVFFYRFPHGESASDVFDRVSTFLDSLWRSFDLHKSRNYVLVTHGISIRVFLARYFRYSIDQFSLLANPKNCEMVILGHDGQGKLRLQGRCEMELNTNEENDEKEIVGYKFHKRLRVLPKSASRKVKIRVSPND